MSSIYIPIDFILNNNVPLEGSEFKHLKVLRKTSGTINLTNGNGKFALAEIVKYNKDNAVLRISKILDNHNENKFISTLFFGIIDDKNRVEFLIEKATELGINNIYPVFFKNSQFKKFDLERNLKKSISAIKQSHRSILPNIYNIISFNDMLESLLKFDYNFLADFEGKKDIKINLTEKNISFIVGPEGGLTNEEKNILNNKVEKIKLSNSILRTETASISLLSKVL